MKKTNQLLEVKLWKDNKLDGEYTIPIEEFKERFFQWLLTKEKAWCNYYGSRAAVAEFIGTELKSVAEFDNKKGYDAYSILSEMVREKFWTMVESELV